MKRIYTAPVLRSQDMQLGVFGDYGDGGGGSDIDITPIKVIERLQMRME